MQHNPAPGAVNRRNYHTLDALRGVAAIAVVMFHYPALLAPIGVSGAYLAVDLFFLMSGFVIAHAYERRFDEGLSAREFVLIRICRLYPMFALGTSISVLGIAAALAAHLPLVWTWRSLAITGASSAIFLPSAPVPGKPHDLYLLNMPAWSLLFEMVVNLVFALTYPWLRRGWLAAVILLGAIGVAIAAWMTGRLDGGVEYPTAWIGMARVTFSFFLGVAMHRAAARGGFPAPRLSASALILIAAALLFYDPPAGSRAMYDMACVLLLFPMLMWTAIHAEPRRGIAACTGLGMISYPLYMIHIPVQTMVIGVIHKLMGSSVELYAPWIGFAVIAALVLQSWLLARYVDPPLRRAIEAVLLPSRHRSRGVEKAESRT